MSRPPFHMTRAPLADCDVTTTGPIRLTSAARTLVDCPRERELDDAVVAMDAALLAGDTDRQQREEATLAARHWPGAPRAARAAALADGRAESPLESRGRLRIVGAGITPPELQVEIRTAGRLVGVVDGWFDEAAVAVEFDGRIKYRDPWRGRSPEQVLWDGKRREDEMRSLDIRFVRIADSDLFTTWARTEAQLRHLLATPGPSDRRFTATARQRGLRRTG